MTHQEEKRRVSLLDSISSTVAKIDPLFKFITTVAAVGAVVYSSLQFLGLLPITTVHSTPSTAVQSPPSSAAPPPSPVHQCTSVVVNDLKVPMEVSYADWNNNRIDLTVPYENHCPEPVTAYVKFWLRATGLRITPTRCDDGNRQDCWERKTLAPGKKSDWQLSTPPLTKLRNSLKPPVSIALQWEIRTENEQTIYAGAAKFSVKD